MSSVLGLDHFCPWPREGLSSKKISKENPLIQHLTSLFHSFNRMCGRNWLVVIRMTAKVSVNQFHSVWKLVICYIV